MRFPTTTIWGKLYALGRGPEAPWTQLCGNFLGRQTINITGDFAYDAGTEENNPSLGPAFVPGQDIDDGGPGEGSIQSAMSLSDFVGLSLAGGLTLNAELIDFINNPDFVFAQIEISEVPLPAAGWLMAFGAGALGFGGRLRQRRAARA